MSTEASKNIPQDAAAWRAPELQRVILPINTSADLIATPDRYDLAQKEKEKWENYILLVLGTAGVGKSAMIPYLAEMTGMKVIKLDDKVQEESGYTMQEMWDTTHGRGEKFFRLMETASFAKASQPEGKNTILDAGGGLTDGDDNFTKIIDTPYIIAGHLTASAEEIVRRLRQDPNASEHRPWFPPNSDPDGQFKVIQERVQRRARRLRKSTSFEINTEGKSPRQIASLFRQNSLREISKLEQAAQSY